MPLDNLEWGSLEPTKRTKYRVFGAKNTLKCEFRGSWEQTYTTKYMDFGATIDVRKPLNGSVIQRLER